MAFFGGEDEEIKKLKKQLGAQGELMTASLVSQTLDTDASHSLDLTDLKIGGLESEKTKNLRQIVELQASATELRSKHTTEVERALTAEEALARLKEESSKKSFQLANLQQALDKAHERESQESKGRRMEEQNRDIAMGRQSQEDHQTIRKLEDKLRTTEAKLKETQEHVRRLEASSASSSRGGRSIDSAAKIMSLENEMTVLRAENKRLSQAGPSSSLQLDAGPSESGSQRPRRPRSSSVSGSSSALTSDATVTRMQVELTDLRRAHSETRTDLDSMTVRAEKAEKDCLKASNEALAHQRRREKQAEESRAEINVLKEDLRWKQTECDGLAKDLETCQRRVEQLETELERAQATGATPQADAAGLSAAIQERDQAKQELQEVRNKLAQLQSTHNETKESLTTLQASSDSMADEALQRMSELEDALTTKDSQISELTLKLKEDRHFESASIAQEGQAMRDTDPINEETVAQVIQLRQEISQLEADLSAKDALIEQAEALAEEDARHLRMKEAEVAQLSSELARLRQNAKENAIEIDLLRAANDDEDGTGVEGKLDDLRDQLKQRDREAQRLQSLVHSKENELEAGKKQLRKIVSFLTNKGLPSDDSLSTPRKVLAEVKVQSTPISKLLKSHHFFATPGGKSMQRGFEEDLLDEIELLRGAIQESEQQQSFLQIERETELGSLRSQAANDASEVQRLQGLLHQAEADFKQLKAQHSADQGQRDAAVDAEQQLLLETQRSRVDELEKEISSLQAQAQEAQETQSESAKAIGAVEAAHEAALAALQAQVDASNHQVAAIASLSERLLEKKQQLGNFERASQAVTQVERLLSHQDSASQHLEQAVTYGTQHQQQLAELTQAGSSSLADCRTWLAVPKVSQIVEIPALPMLDSSEDAQPLEESAQVSNLRNKIQELEGRVLRREEQIGSHQLKLESLTTKLDMAYDDYEELLEEKVDLEHELVDLKAKLDVSIKEHSEISQRLQTELHEANEALQSSTRRLEEEMSKVASLEDRNVELSRSHVDLDLDEAEIADNEALRSELALAQQELDRLSKELLSQQDQASMLQQQLDQRTGEFEALQSSHSEVSPRPETLQTTPTSSDGDDLNQLHTQITALEEEIAALQSSHADHLLAEQTEVDALERELAATVAELQAVSEKLTQADEELSGLRVTMERVESERDAKSAELASAVEALNGAAGDDQLVATLQQQIKTLEVGASTAQESHTTTVQELQTKVAEAEERAQSLEAQESALHTELDDLRRAADEAKTLSEQVSTLEAQKANLQRSYADLEASAAEAEASAQDKYTQVSASLQDLESRLRSVLDDLEEREKALASAECAIKERDEHIQSRNDEFWNLKEEVAELQEAAERSRVASQSVEALESQLRDLEVENERLLQVQEELKSRQAELVVAQQKFEAAERESVLKQTELSDLQTEMKRRKAVNRMNEEDNQALKLQVQEAAAAQRSLQMDLAGHEDELNSARLSVDTLNGQITRLQGELATALTTAATGSSSAVPDDLLEEVSYLNSRVSELEQELDAKNEEIDTADTRIIASLKENKKLSGKVKALQSQVVTLQQQQQQVSSSSAMSMTKVAGHGDGSTATKPTSSPILPANNKKRSAPDDAAQPAAPAVARAMYVAASPETSTRSVNKGSFTPVRKVKPLGSPRKGESTTTPGLQDRTNVKTKSQLMDVFAVSGKKPIVAATGEKKAAALGGSNALMAALAAKRKINTQV